MTFLHTEILASLKQRLEERQDAHRRAMAKGLASEPYWKLVGAHKECSDLIETIEEIEKGDDEDADSDNEGARKSRNQAD